MPTRETLARYQYLECQSHYSPAGRQLQGENALEVCMQAWLICVYTGSGFSAALRNGGPASLVWGLMFSITGTLALALSLAEMASICPIAGAQYHWTALFAPPKIRPFVTWMQG